MDRAGGSTELFGQPDHDALGAADVTEPITVLELLHLTDELGTVAAQPGDHVLDVVDGEHDAADAQRIHGWIVRGRADGLRSVERRQLDPAVPVWSPEHGNVLSAAVDADDTIRPVGLDLRPAL